MSEEKKQQVERIVDALDANKREAVLAFMLGMAAGARMAEATAKEGKDD